MPVLLFLMHRIRILFQGKSDLNGVLRKHGDEIYVIDVKSEPQTIQKLRLEGDKYYCDILDTRNGVHRSHAATAIYKSKNPSYCQCIT